MNARRIQCTTMAEIAAVIINFIRQLLMSIAPANLWDDLFAVAYLSDSDDSPDLDLPESHDDPDLYPHLPESDDSYAAWFSDDKLTR